MSKLYRQGDILFRQVKSFKKGLQPVAIDAYLVAEGEQTGHFHRLVSGGMKVMAGPDGVAGGVALANPGTVTHNEHDPITLEPGNYEISQELENDTLADQAYAVSD